MTQEEQRIYLIQFLLAENNESAHSLRIPENSSEQKALLRALMNVRCARPVPQDVLNVQDAYLQARVKERGITSLEDITQQAMKAPLNTNQHIYLWQGDITTLEVGGIVNAANNEMLGCFVPGHHCIDNCIHTYAGMQLRLECARIMNEQGHLEPTGSAKITSAFNLPSKYILHTVGPIVNGAHPSAHDEELLASCYTSCLNAARKNNIESLAFCCISTGVFGYPNTQAAHVAIQAVTQWLNNNKDYAIDVIFNTFLECDTEIYKDLLCLM